MKISPYQKARKKKLEEVATLLYKRGWSTRQVSDFFGGVFEATDEEVGKEVVRLIDDLPGVLPSRSHTWVWKIVKDLAGNE